MLSLHKVRAFFFSQRAALLAPSHHASTALRAAHDEQQVSGRVHQQAASPSATPAHTASSQPVEAEINAASTKKSKSSARSPREPRQANRSETPDSPNRGHPAAMQCDSPILGSPAPPTRAFSLWETTLFCAIPVHLVDSIHLHGMAFPGGVAQRAFLPKTLALARMLLRTEKERERKSSTSTRCRWKCGFQGQPKRTKHVAYVS
jgi:hypothetical protein